MEGSNWSQDLQGQSHEFSTTSPSDARSTAVKRSTIVVTTKDEVAAANFEFFSP